MNIRRITVLALLSTVLIVGCNQTPDENLALEMAEKSYHDQNYPEAILHLKRAIQASPDDKQARLLMADVLLKIGDATDAERHIRKAIELGSAPQETFVDLITALIKQKKYDAVLESLSKQDGDLRSLSDREQANISAIKGQALLGKGDLANSEDAFNRALAIDKQCVRAYIGLAALSAHQDNFDKANNYIKTAFKYHPNDTDAWLFTADMARIKGDLPKAIESYTQVIDNSYPNSIEHQLSRLYRAFIFAYQNKFEDAWRDIRKAKSASGETTYLNYVTGIIAFQEKDYSKAESALEKVVSVLDDHLYAHYLLGAIYTIQNQPQRARDHLIYVAKIHPDNRLAQKLLAMVEFKLGETQNAESRLTNLLHDQPDDIEAYNLLGQHYITSGNPQKGVEYLNKSLESKPNSQEAKLRYGIGLIEMGSYQLAEEAFKAVMDADKNNLAAQFYQLMSFLQQNKPEQALELSEKLTKENPDNLLAQTFKGICYLTMHRTPEAKRQFEQVLKRDPNDINAHFNLANIAFDSDQKAEAKKHLDEVVKAHPTLIKAYLKEAQFELQSGNPQKAERWLIRALKQEPNHVQASLALSKLYSQQKKSTQALDILLKLDNKSKLNPAVILATADLFIQANQTANAHQKLNEFANYYPKQLENRNYLTTKALLLMQEKQFNKAVDLYQKISKKYPGTESAVTLANAYWVIQKPSQATQTLQAWLVKNPNDSIAQLALANYYLWLSADNAGQYKQPAIDAFNRAQVLMPNHPFVLNNLAWLLKETDLNRAFDLAQQAAKLSADQHIHETYQTIQAMKAKQG